MKVLRPKSIFTLLYGLAIMIPCFAIGTTCLYVQFNKNAYQSYSGKNDSNMILQNVESFEKDKKYNLQTHNNTYDSQITEAQNYIVASKVFISDSVYTNIRIGFYRVAGSTEANVYLRELDNNNNLIYTGNLANTNLQVNVSFIFDYQVNTFSNTLYQFFNYQDYMTNYYQDNVFYYAVDKFTKDNNFGEIDFFYYFRGMFLSDTSVNNQWFNFINWYMNYAMLLSCAYILFLAMMWFINFARKLLEKGFNAYDW